MTIGVFWSAGKEKIGLYLSVSFVQEEPKLFLNQKTFAAKTYMESDLPTCTLKVGLAVLIGCLRVRLAGTGLM